jgi:deoxyribonucleoside regulator
MTKYRRGDDRNELLAGVAEMYYMEELTQAEIARAIGLTRSAVSRMLSEARQKGIVEIRVRRPLRFDHELERALVERFGLKAAHALICRHEGQYDKLRLQLGKAAAQVLQDLLVPNMVLGIAWGTTLSATIDALEVLEPVNITVVQLVGVLGPSSHTYNAQALVELLARKVGGKGIYQYTPLIVEDADTARSLLNTQTVREVITVGKQCDVALLGIGTTDPQFSSLYRGGYITIETLEALREAGAVGDVNAYHFDIEGRMSDIEFHDRLLGIARDDLLKIPTRLGVAGGTVKAPAILGALRGGYVNLLVTDNSTAALVLELDDST